MLIAEMQDAQYPQHCVSIVLSDTQWHDERMLYLC